VTLFCDDDSGTETERSLIEATFTPGTYFVVVDGFSTDRFGDYNLRVTRADGHAVLIGHDFFENEANADRLVGNAVFLTPQRGVVNVLEYRQFADTALGGEVLNTRAAITTRAAALGRTVNFTTLTDFTMLDLGGTDVLLVPEQETTTNAMMATVGAAWNARLNAFLDRGGVIVVCDYGPGLGFFEFGKAYQVLNGTGLLTFGAPATIRDVTSGALTRAAAGDPLIAGVAAAYVAPDGSLAWPGVTGGTAVVSQGADPVVVHLTR
jgi:hypothetical protein